LNENEEEVFLWKNAKWILMARANRINDILYIISLAIRLAFELEALPPLCFAI